MPTSKPFDICVEAFDRSFWQNHTIAVDASGPVLHYTQQRDADAGGVRDLLARHVEKRRSTLGPKYLLTASANVVEINRCILSTDPLPSSLALDTPRGHRAAGFLARMATRAEKRAGDDIQRALHRAQESFCHKQIDACPEAAHEHMFEVWTANLVRMQSKYDELMVWAKGAIACAHLAKQRALEPATTLLTEPDDWHALRQQVQRSIATAKQDLTGFENVLVRATPAAASLRRNLDAIPPAKLRPVLAPNFLTGGTLLLCTLAQVEQYERALARVLARMEDVRLHAIGPRLADWMQADALLLQALRLRRGDARHAAHVRLTAAGESHAL